MPSPVIYAVAEFAAFFLATINFRYCAKGHIGRTLITDVLAAANGFIVIRLVAEATSPFEMAGYVVGATLGSLVGMLVTKNLEESK